MLDQEISTKEKIKVVQKIILGIGIFCAIIALFNFFILFNAGLKGLSQRIIEKQVKESVIEHFK